jgi:S1-C subfamily serine protease
MRARLGLSLNEGVLVGTVDPRAPAGKIGVQPYDIILKWNDHVASDPVLLSRAIAATEIGSTAKLVLVRAEANGKDKKELALNVKVERRPKDESER